MDSDSDQFKMGDIQTIVPDMASVPDPLAQVARAFHTLNPARRPRIGITLDSVDPTQQDHGAAYSYELWYALRYRYADAIAKAGGLPLALPHQIDLIDDYVSELDGLLITGGGFDVDPALYGADQVHPTVFLKPVRTQFEMAICMAFLKAKKPILGICGGMQLINVAFGGTLIQHVLDLTFDAIQKTTAGVHARVPLLEHAPKFKPTETAHTITIARDTLLANLMPKMPGVDHKIPLSIDVNSVHHQAVEKLGQGLIMNAWSNDGILEGFEKIDESFILGIQWHPEFLMNEFEMNIFKAFIQATEKAR